MPDHEPRPPEPIPPKPRRERDLPASVVFMEMMRRAASQAEPPAPASAPPDDPETPTDAAPARTRAEEATDAPRRPRTVEPPQRPPLTPEQRQRAAELEAQKLKRVQRRTQKRRRRAVSVLGGLVRTFLVITVSATLMATILSWWTSAEFLRPDLRRDLQAAINPPLPTFAPTPTRAPNYMKTIGIVSGHRGPGRGTLFDPGAVCPDGLREVDINYDVAQRVVDKLRQRGYTAQLLDEFDPRLDAYVADALVSIHANDCRDYGEVVSGFLVAKAEAKPEGGPDTALAECIAVHYELITGMQRRFGLTKDMTDYHSFREIDPLTPAAIIELGFMLADRYMLTEQPDLLARGVVEGIICFLEPDAALIDPDFPLPTPVGTPAA